MCVYVCARFCFIHICEGVHLYTEILQLEHRNCVLSVWAQISRKNLHREKKNDIGVHPFDTIVCVFFCGIALLSISTHNLSEYFPYDGS